MSLTGFKKNLNKANQFFVEKVSGVKGSAKEAEFKEMEKKVDACNHLFTNMTEKTMEYLQPNPTIRAKMTLVTTSNKLQGKQKNLMYPQTEGQLASCMNKYGEELGEDSSFGSSLIAAADAYRQIADCKYTLEDNVKQHFLEPLKSVQSRDIKDINHMRKKLESRRLDYDCKKRKSDKSPSAEHGEETRVAETKYEETKEQAECRMIQFLQSETEHIAALSAFISAEMEFHQQTLDILQKLNQSLDLKKQEAQSRPRVDLSDRIKKNSTWSSAGDDYSNNSLPNSPPGHSSGPSFSIKSKKDNNVSKVATARALFEFIPESDVELGFDEGDIIKLIEQVDENWYYGEFKGKEGHFPVNYVEVLVPL